MEVASFSPFTLVLLQNHQIRKNRRPGAPSKSRYYCLSIAAFQDYTNSPCFIDAVLKMGPRNLQSGAKFTELPRLSSLQEGHCADDL
jgi:hypothetical protein